MSLAISMNAAASGGSDARLGSEHALTLRSPAASFDVESCLELIYAAQSPFFVRLGCVAYSGAYSERTLYGTRLPLGLTTHKIKLPLPATASEYRNCSLAFHATATTPGVAAVVSNIAVFPGRCPSAR